jgi:pimeloyl-ACP methyl ester carboxylesterase
LFLPGASGSASFWKPVADRAGVEGVFFAWPGLGDQPARPDINGIDDLVALVADEIVGSVDIIAQSMGGLIAIKLALAFPGMVERLVLAVTSGGVPVADLGGSDWRPDYFAAYPRAAKWIADPVGDLSRQIPTIEAPTLLLWSDADSISPLAVGKRLAALFPNARLCVFAGADHDLVRTHMDAVAAEIKHHLATS